MSRKIKRWPNRYLDVTYAHCLIFCSSSFSQEGRSPFIFDSSACSILIWKAYMLLHRKSQNKAHLETYSIGALLWMNTVPFCLYTKHKDRSMRQSPLKISSRGKCVTRNCTVSVGECLRKELKKKSMLKSIHFRRKYSTRAGSSIHLSQFNSYQDATTTRRSPF